LIGLLRLGRIFLRHLRPFAAHPTPRIRSFGEYRPVWKSSRSWRERSSGSNTFVDPAPLVRWAFGDSYPASALTDAVNNKTLFMNWFQETVVKSVPDTRSDSLFIYVGSTADPTERNQYSG
jgi:hypothetical protein